jgi:hypothetical protein
VLVHGGFYYVDGPVIFDQNDSVPGYSVTYENYGNDEVFLAGGQKMTLPDLTPDRFREYVVFKLFIRKTVRLGTYGRQDKKVCL